MTEEDLRIECLSLEIPASGLDKSAIQRQLLGHIVARATSTPASQTRAPQVYAAVNPDQAGQTWRVPLQQNLTWRMLTTE